MSDPFGPVAQSQPAPAGKGKTLTLEQDAAHVAELTAKLVAVQRLIPHPLGRVLFGVLISGVELDAQTKHPRVGPGTLLNFAPAPLGFMHPQSFGFKPNWWLPEGSTTSLPPQFADLGLGLPEQMQSDQARAASQAARDFGNTLRQLQFESDETIEQLATGTGGPLTRASQLRAVPVGSSVNLKTVAQVEQIRRENLRAGVFVPAPPVEQAQFSAPREGLTLNLFAAAAPMGSTLPALVQPVVDAAIRNAEAAVGIRRDLAQERADP